MANYMEQNLMEVKKKKKTRINCNPGLRCPFKWESPFRILTNILVQETNPTRNNLEIRNKSEFSNRTMSRFFPLLFQGGDLGFDEHPPLTACPLLLQWIKTDLALVMLFNNGSLQVKTGEDFLFRSYLVSLLLNQSFQCMECQKTWRQRFWLFSCTCIETLHRLNCHRGVWGWVCVIIAASSSSQVNFYPDHTKVILCKLSDSYLLTYISQEQVSNSYPLSMLCERGCSSELRHRLQYVVRVLQQYTIAWPNHPELGPCTITCC